MSQLDYGTNQSDPCCATRNGPHRTARTRVLTGQLDPGPQPGYSRRNSRSVIGTRLRSEAAQRFLLIVTPFSGQHQQFLSFKRTVKFKFITILLILSNTLTPSPLTLNNIPCQAVRGGGELYGFDINPVAKCYSPCLLRLSWNITRTYETKKNRATNSVHKVQACPT